MGGKHESCGFQQWQCSKWQFCQHSGASAWQSQVRWEQQNKGQRNTQRPMSKEKQAERYPKERRAEPTEDAQTNFAPASSAISRTLSSWSALGYGTATDWLPPSAILLPRQSLRPTLSAEQGSGLKEARALGSGGRNHV